MSNLEPSEMATEQNYRADVQTMAEQVVAALRDADIGGSISDPDMWTESAGMVNGSRWVDQPYYAGRMLLWSACADAVFEAGCPELDYTCYSMGDIYCKVAWFAMVADVANAARELWEVLS